MTEEKISLADIQNIRGIKSEDVTEEEAKELLPTAEKMIEMCSELGGIGLAAPQIGLFKKMFVFMISANSFQVVFNPTWYNSGKKTNVLEGCLSLEGKDFLLKRPKEIRAVWYSLTSDGKFHKVSRTLKKEKAFVFVHESDHLNGVDISMVGESLE